MIIYCNFHSNHLDKEKYVSKKLIEGNNIIYKFQLSCHSKTLSVNK